MAFFTPRIQSKGTEVHKTARRETGRQAAGIIPAPSAQEKAKGEEEGRRVCIMSTADKFGHLTPSGMGRLMLDKWKTTALGTATILKLMTPQENSPFCQIFPSILLQVMGISAFPKLLGSLGPGKQKGPWQKKPQKFRQCWKFCCIPNTAGSPLCQGGVSPVPALWNTHCRQAQRKCSGTFLPIPLCCASSQAHVLPRFLWWVLVQFLYQAAKPPKSPFSSCRILLQSKLGKKTWQKAQCPPAGTSLSISTGIVQRGGKPAQFCLAWQDFWDGCL